MDIDLHFIVAIHKIMGIDYKDGNITGNYFSIIPKFSSENRILLKEELAIVLINKKEAIDTGYFFNSFDNSRFIRLKLTNKD